MIDAEGFILENHFLYDSGQFVMILLCIVFSMPKIITIMNKTIKSIIDRSRLKPMIRRSYDDMSAGPQQTSGLTSSVVRDGHVSDHLGLGDVEGLGAAAHEGVFEGTQVVTVDVDVVMIRFSSDFQL